MSQSDKEFDNVDFEVIIRKKPKIDMKQVKEVRVILEEISEGLNCFENQ